MKVEFDEEQIQKVIRELSNVVVSLDRIGGSAVDLPEGEWEKAAIEYLVENQVLECLSMCRYVLDCGIDGEEVADIPDNFGTEKNCWSFKEYVAKKDI